MESKIKLANHPLHPMLVNFPIAGYTAATLCFIAYRFFTVESFWFRVGVAATGFGVVTAVLAALVGSVDLFVAVPKNTAARRTGWVHALWNTGALLLFAISWYAQAQKWDDIRPDPGSSVFLSFVGLVCAGIASWYGYEMVQTHHVGLNNSMLRSPGAPFRSTSAIYPENATQQNRRRTG